MKVNIQRTAEKAGKLAGSEAADQIRNAIANNGEANIILATGKSQFETINQLIKEKGIDWSKVNMFHLDEYIGIAASHPASFRRYLKERFLDKVPPLKSVCLINGENDPAAECRRIGELIKKYPVDVALTGIGENAHLAFNDPPADFDTKEPYIVAALDHECRQQQVNEGWFAEVKDVPTGAISMSVSQIMLSKCIICSVPEKRKAVAVRDSLENEVSNMYPASILQKHPNCYLFLEEASASLLKHRETYS